MPERLLVEGDASTKIIHAVSGSVVTSLAGGVLSPAKDLIVQVGTAGGVTAVRGVDLDSLPMLKVDLDGTWALPGAYGAAPSGFSPNGRWLVLVSRAPGQSTFAVIDAARSKLAAVVKLGDRFAFDAIHNDGSAMYLIEHPVAGSTAYNVRLYDLRANSLTPDIIFDKSQIAQFDPTVGLMDGTFHVSVAPTVGDWSFGLYMRPNGTPFVHALNVPGRYATCIIDLAGKWTAASRFSMALADDGRRLYVVDATTGAASAIDTQTQKVILRSTFAGRPADSDTRSATAVVSKDGAQVFASGERGVAMLRSADLSLIRWAATDLAIRSLAASADGTRVYALAGDTVHVISIATGLETQSYAAMSGARAIHLLPVP
ncbi:MAG: hypothetical protein M3R54_01170 [Chloroflexota bacterium]|nr:hypothetical protein [Chloroflexota bacterium]